MSFGPARVRLVQAGAALAAAALVAGCGNNYRPVVTPINPTGPSPEPQSMVVAVSAPLPTAAGIAQPGIATIIDYSGDSVMAEAPIGPGPTTFTLDTGGSTGYTINSDHTLTNFPASTSLQEKNVNYTTLPSTAEPVNLLSPGSGLWAADLDGDVADTFTGFPQTFLRAIPLAPTPVMVASSSTSAQRFYGISQGNSQGENVSSAVACNLSPTTGPVGDADGIEVSSSSVSSQIALGQCPVYAVGSGDGQRLYVLNRGSDTVTVINTQANTLDACTGLVNRVGQPVTCHPTLPVSPAPGLTHAGPVYAEYNAATSQLIVANYDGNSISVIDVSLDEYGNDSPTFGTTFTIPVGNHPASVTVVADAAGNLRAYTANQADQTVTIVNVSSHTVEKTLAVTGYPRTVVSTANSTQGKVYVVSPNSPYLTIIRTDLDVIDTTMLLQGNVVDVRVSTQNAVSGNNNYTSRTPGHGQPCNLPDLPGGYQVSGAPAGTTVEPSSSLADCQAQDVTLLK
jgi:DNA-binding beta-propeller fold protein YncE